MKQRVARVTWNVRERKRKRVIELRWIKRKDRLRVILESLPQTHSYSSSHAHALSVTVTSTLPFYSSTLLWRRSALVSFIHCHAISIFLSGHCVLSWNFSGGRRGGGGVGGSPMFGFIRAHQISDHAEIVIRSHMRAKLHRWNYVICSHKKLKQNHDTVLFSNSLVLV